MIGKMVCKGSGLRQVPLQQDLQYLVFAAGLDEAILGNMNSDDPEQGSAHIAELLKHGAHSLIAQEDQKAKESEEFQNEDITEILAQRTEKRQIGSRAGNTFSTAEFLAQEPEVSELCTADGCLA